MCGIFGYVGQKSNAADMVLTGLKSLEYRGYDSWGVAAVPLEQSEKIVVKKNAGKIGAATVDDLPTSSFAFGHTRWATHGGVTDTNAHPHLDCSHTIALVHNGIIENYQELRHQLQQKGHIFVSETDTEVAVHLIEETTKTLPFTQAVRAAFRQLKGLNAIIAIHLKERVFIAARLGSPLIIGFGEKENLIASDAAALLPYTRTVHFLEENELAEIYEDHAILRDATTGEEKQWNKQQLDWTPDQAIKGNFPHFMLKEISEQPRVLETIATVGAKTALETADTIQHSYGGYMIGCGTAAYACIAGTYLFSELAKRHINWAIGSEFGYQQDFLTDKSLVIALSQSGETMDTLEAVRKAKAKGTKIISFVNVLGSSLYRESDHSVLLLAGPEKGVASTKAFTAKLAHITLLATALAGNATYGIELIHLAAKATEDLLQPPSRSSIAALATQILHASTMFVVGRGISYAASLESALKIKEISYIHAEGLAGGELKHGPLALIEKGTPCIVLAPSDEAYADTMAGAMEMKARGGLIIGFSSIASDVFDIHIPIPDAKEATIIPIVVAAQLLAYELSVQKGLDPDMPRNLAKSVTVK